MADLELLVVVLASVLLMTWTARTLRLSEPLLLLAGGVLLGLVPRFDHVQLPPDVILMLVLPALLYWESLTTSTREVRDNFRSIALSATGLVLVTALAVGVVAHALGYAWPIAFVLGAVLAPTDASAVGASVQGMPRRIVTLLRTESLLNDGTAFVLLAVGLETLTTGDPFSFTHTTIRFVESYLGGMAIGALVALVLIQVRRHLTDRILHSGLSVTTPFLAFLPAAAMHVSGTLAVVICGLVTSRIGPKVIGSGERIQATSFWEVTSFLLNGALFVLVGMQTPAAVRALTSVSLLQAAAISAAVSVTVVAARAAWFYTMPYMFRLVDRRARQQERRIGARQRLPLAWAGMRGAISLAAALTIPATTSDGKPVVQRDALVFITVVVIAVTLVVLGPSLPAVVRHAQFGDDPTETDEEDLAVRHIAAVALAEMPVLADRLRVPASVTDRVAGDLARLAQAPDLSDDAATGGYRQESAVHSLQEAVLGVKRAALIDLRRRRRIDDDVMRRVQNYLDLEEQGLQKAVLLRHHLGTATQTPDKASRGPSATP
jgi:monovalent cation/hydrogen antiporter